MDEAFPVGAALEPFERQRVAEQFAAARAQLERSGDSQAVAQAQTFDPTLPGPVVARGSVSAVTTLDMTDGNFFQAIAAGSTTFVFANPPVSAISAGAAAGGFILELQNGGAATITWPSTVRWPGGTAPTLTASGFDVFVFITDDAGTNWRGVQSMRDSK
jgi:hypothetical protein